MKLFKKLTAALVKLGCRSVEVDEWDEIAASAVSDNHPTITTISSPQKTKTKKSRSFKPAVGPQGSNKENTTPLRCLDSGSSWGRGFVYYNVFSGDETNWFIVEPAKGCPVEQMPSNVLNLSLFVEDQSGQDDRVLCMDQDGAQYFVRLWVGGTLDEKTGKCNIPPMRMDDDGPTWTATYTDGEDLDDMDEPTSSSTSAGSSSDGVKESKSKRRSNDKQEGASKRQRVREEVGATVANKNLEYKGSEEVAISADANNPSVVTKSVEKLE